MGGYTLSLDVPIEEETEDTIHQFYDFVEDKRDEYCDDDEPLRVEERRQNSLEALNERRLFFIDVPVGKKTRKCIDWSDIEGLMDDNWKVSGDDIAILASLLRSATSEVSAEDDEWNYECFTETGPAAICEFALQNGYTVRIID